MKDRDGYFVPDNVDELEAQRKADGPRYPAVIKAKALRILKVHVGGRTWTGERFQVLAPKADGSWNPIGNRYFQTESEAQAFLEAQEEGKVSDG